MPVNKLIVVNGRVKFIHDDELATAMLKHGEMEISRASHVEPVSGGRWECDLSPVGGPKIGTFATREAALECERAWLIDNTWR
jgi:hypothetical protein